MRRKKRTERDTFDNRAPMRTAERAAERVATLPMTHPTNPESPMPKRKPSEKYWSKELEVIEDALDLARAGTWDAHYGRGMSVEYAQSVDRAVRKAMAAAHAQEKRIRCVKGGAGYWNKIRVDFPQVFARMAAQERELGASILRRNGERVFLDELDPSAGNYKAEEAEECSLLCSAALMEAPRG